MSGVKNLALADTHGTHVLTNNLLKEEGIKGRDEKETKKKPA